MVRRMIWPWARKAEDRASDAFGAAAVAALVAQASGGVNPAQAASTAAVEAAAGLLGRAFGAADVTAPEPIKRALTPATLEMIGRQIIRTGDHLVRIRVADNGGRIVLDPVGDWDVRGSYDASTWTYRAHFGGPSRTTTARGLTRDECLHFMYAAEPRRPWIGLGPLQFAALAGRLSAEVAAALGDEAGAPRGSFLPVPKPGDDPTMSGFRAAVRGAAGKLLTVESGDWGNDGASVAPSEQYKPRRFGAMFPQAMVDLSRRAFIETLSACGVAPAVFEHSGAQPRESWRQVLFGFIAPLARIVEAELQRGLGAEVGLSFADLRASDLQARARSFQAMVQGGKTVDEAATLAGLMLPEDD